MPKTIEAYKRTLGELPDHRSTGSFWITLLIVVILLTALCHSSYDAYNRWEKDVPINEQQSKLCLA